MDPPSMNEPVEMLKLTPVFFCFLQFLLLNLCAPIMYIQSTNKYPCNWMLSALVPPLPPPKPPDILPYLLSSPRPPLPHSLPSTPRPQVHLAYCIFGIIGSLMLYGVLQERIMTRPFGAEHWNSSLFLVLCNRLTSLVVAYTAM